MFVGFDVHRAAKGSKGPSIGAMVATTSSSFASYFSTISYHKDPQDLSINMASDMESKCNYLY